MNETRMIETPHGTITAVTEEGRDGRDGAGVLLAHGAGAGQDHPWMVAMRGAIAALGVTTTTFDYAYTEAGRKAPDRLPKLLDVHEAVAAAVAADGSLVLAGKSMGGRVGGHLVAERSFPAIAVVYLGYPLVPLGKSEPRDTTHLESITVPQLFISGDRDRMGPAELISSLAERVPRGRFVAIETGDHSLKPLKSSGRSVDSSIRTAATEIAGLVGA